MAIRHESLADTKLGTSGIFSERSGFDLRCARDTFDVPSWFGSPIRLLTPSQNSERGDKQNCCRRCCESEGPMGWQKPLPKPGLPRGRDRRKFRRLTFVAESCESIFQFLNFRVRFARTVPEVI